MRYTTQKYDTSKHNFLQIVSDLFSCHALGIALKDLHTRTNIHYDLFEVGKDSSTVFHKQFYDKYHDGWEELQIAYDSFIEEIIAKEYNDDILYQKFPTFRVHLPQNIAVGAYHNDGEFHHPAGEVNYVIPLTNSEDTASIWVESMPGKKDFAAMSMKVGEVMKFNGNKLRHGNEINKTKFTRVSMDFRVMPAFYYSEEEVGESMTLKTKFKEGHYYKRLQK